MNKSNAEKFYYYRNKLIEIIFTKYVYFKATLWDITLGKKSSFRGNVLFYKTKGSKIIIGEKCRFNSLNYFNFRGLNHKCILQTGTNEAIIEIGNNCGFSGVSIVCDKKVKIGNNVLCGANVRIGDRNGHFDIYPIPPKDIHIEDNVWIGMNCSIMPGVQIGANSIVGAGSIVTKNIPSNEIWAGVPAKFIKKR